MRSSSTQLKELDQSPIVLRKSLKFRGKSLGDRKSGMERRHIDKGKYIFRQDEVGDMAFLVVSGTVEIVKQVDDREVTLGSVSNGGIFGEMALIDDQPRMASARAAGQNVDLIIITRKMFQKKLESSDPFVQGLVCILVHHVRSIAGTLRNTLAEVA